MEKKAKCHQYIGNTVAQGHEHNPSSGVEGWMNSTEDKLNPYRSTHTSRLMEKRCSYSPSHSPNYLLTDPKQSFLNLLRLLQILYHKLQTKYLLTTNPSRNWKCIKSSICKIILRTSIFPNLDCPFTDIRWHIHNLRTASVSHTWVWNSIAIWLSGEPTYIFPTF